MKNLIALFVFGLLFVFVTKINAQDKRTEKKDNQTTMQNDDMQKCMDKMSSDDQMHDGMMEGMKTDSSGMMQMCKSMMDNPEMHKMMMGMMSSDKMMNHDMMDNMDKKSCCKGSMDNNMLNDSTETMNNSDHESHHLKK